MRPTAARAPLDGAPLAAEVLRTYFVVTAGHGGLMARFDDDGRLAEWTPYIRRASVFLTSEAGHAAIRAICRPEIDAAVRAGRAMRELDEETGEIVVMDYAGRRPRPFPIPSIRLDGPGRSLGLTDDGDANRAHLSPRQLARAVFQEARRNPTRQSESLIPIRPTGTEYTSPMSARARRAGAYAHL